MLYALSPSPVASLKTWLIYVMYVCMYSIGYSMMECRVYSTVVYICRATYMYVYLVQVKGRINVVGAVQWA